MSGLVYMYVFVIQHALLYSHVTTYTICFASGSQKLQAAAAAQTYTPATRPSSTAAFPTPTTHATTHSHSTPVTSGGSTVSSTSQSWHEVTRTTRTVQLTVSNNLVGRIIGRGGSKINNIQVSTETLDQLVT